MLLPPTFVTAFRQVHQSPGLGEASARRAILPRGAIRLAPRLRRVLPLMDHTLLAGGDHVARTADANQAAVLAADRLPLIVVADVVAGTAASGEGHLPGKAADVGVRIVDLRAGTAGAGRVQVPHAAPTAVVLVVIIIIVL